MIGLMFYEDFYSGKKSNTGQPYSLLPIDKIMIEREKAKLDNICCQFILIDFLRLREVVFTSRLIKARDKRTSTGSPQIFHLSIPPPPRMYVRKEILSTCTRDL